jgi:hypothetical protein
MTHALGICTAKKDLVTVALFAALADNDVTVGVALCGVHGLVSLCGFEYSDGDQSHVR